MRVKINEEMSTGTINKEHVEMTFNEIKEYISDLAYRESGYLHLCIGFVIGVMLQIIAIKLSKKLGREIIAYAPVVGLAILASAGFMVSLFTYSTVQHFFFYYVFIDGIYSLIFAAGVLFLHKIRK